MVSSRGEGLGARDGFQKKRRFRDQGLVPEEEGVRDRGMSLIWGFEFQSMDQGWFPVTGEEEIQGLEIGGEGAKDRKWVSRTGGERGS